MFAQVVKNFALLGLILARTLYTKSMKQCGTTKKKSAMADLFTQLVLIIAVFFCGFLLGAK